MSYIYIASPYTDPDWEVMVKRFTLAEEVTAQLLRQGDHIYSPIVHCHELAQKHELPTDFEFWQNYNRAMLSKASELYVLAMDGWEDSKGVQAEREFAKQCGIPVTIVEELE